MRVFNTIQLNRLAINQNQYTIKNNISYKEGNAYKYYMAKDRENIWSEMLGKKMQLIQTNN